MLASVEQGATRSGSSAACKQAIRSQVRLRSCCGDNSSWIDAVPCRNALRLRDAELVTGARWRLGLSVCHTGKWQLCPVARSDSPSHAEDKCGICLDPHGDHIVSCKKSGGAQRVHGAIGRIVGNAAGDVGAEQFQSNNARTSERFAWLRRCREGYFRRAHMERLSMTHGSVGHAMIPARRDTEVVQRLLMASQPGWVKMPGNEGVVTTAAIEGWGRMGQGFEMLLGRLEALWAACHFARPAETAVVGRRWRNALGIAQVKCLHRFVELAQGAVGGADTAPT